MMLRLFAPFLPYCTEEAWSWWQEGSIHLSSWPSGAALAGAAGPGAQPDLLEAVAEVLVAVRRAKTEAKGSMRRPVARCTVTGPPSLVGLVELASDDLVDAGAIATLDLLAEPGSNALSVEVELAARIGLTRCGSRPRSRRSRRQCSRGNTWANTSRRGMRSRTTVAKSSESRWRTTTIAIWPARPSGDQPLSTVAAVKWPVNATRHVATREAS